MDLYVHTDAFYDCEMPVEVVLARTAAVGLDAVVITDRDSIGTLPRAFNIVHEYGVRVVPGVEVPTADGHLLALRIDDPPVTRQPLSGTAQGVREVGGLAVVPHPFQTSRHGTSWRTIRDVGAIEAYNAHMLTGLGNGQVRRYARRQELPDTSGSDAHRPALVGQACTAVSVEADGGVAMDTILEGIRVGQTVTRETRTAARQYLRKYALNARLRTAPFL